jgi:hypothetical protein
VNRKHAISVLLPVLALLLLAAPAARAAESAGECVQLKESMEPGGLALRVDNDCDRGLACVLSWTVQCQTESGKVTRSSKDGARVVVQATRSAHAVASAKSCGDSWKIDDVRWDCSPLR